MDSSIIHYLPSYLSILLASAAILLTSLFWRNASKKGKFPPGPGWALPIVGNLLQLGTKPHLTFFQWKKKYGPMIFFKMGTLPTVIINDGKLMKELLPSSAPNGRLTSAMWNVLSSGGKGILFNAGPVWEEQRSYAIRILKELGSGGRKGNLEEISLEEAKSILTFFEDRVGLPIQGRRCFVWPVVSSLWAMVTGERFEWFKDGNIVDSEISKKSADITECVNDAAKSGLTYLDWLRHIAPERLGWNRFVNSMTKFLEFMGENVREHETTLDPNCPRDLIDQFLIRIGNTEDPTSSFYGDTGRHNLRVVLSDLFIAGSETTSTAMEFALLYLTQHPDIQERLQNELDQVVGRSRLPVLGDRGSLPFTQAVILEILRHASVVSITPHTCLEDVEFHGYHLPKDTMILLDIYTSLHDVDVWGSDAHIFRPDRFLSDKGEIVHRDGFFPFLIGKRACIGESLAKDTLFLFLTTIFQRFSVELYPKGSKVDYNDIVPGFTMEPQPFEFCVNFREQV